ncbi:MAG: hypothetical protein DWQ35_21145 [Planctomycetota bacterium]|nr:MAG: hypothetical protein DWQ35_21145 [Planctomycetota bacterium]REK30172.1 MAG: hypothetical protein DWQ42_01975 [Planctomycetota bacterium]REK43301.1 MAG: hypothetical protein DWQ46_11820 [Planctomycetota bacterium]
MTKFVADLENELKPSFEGVGGSRVSADGPPTRLRRGDQGEGGLGGDGHPPPPGAWGAVGGDWLGDAVSTSAAPTSASLTNAARRYRVRARSTTIAARPGRALFDLVGGGAATVFKTAAQRVQSLVDHPPGFG